MPPLYPYQFAVIYEMMAYAFFNFSADPVWRRAEQIVVYRGMDSLLHYSKHMIEAIRMSAFGSILHSIKCFAF